MIKFKRQNTLSLKSSIEIEQWGLIEDCVIQIWVQLMDGVSVGSTGSMPQGGGIRKDHAQDLHRR